MRRIRTAKSRIQWCVKLVRELIRDFFHYLSWRVGKVMTGFGSLIKIKWWKLALVEFLCEKMHKQWSVTINHLPWILAIWKAVCCSPWIISLASSRDSKVFVKETAFLNYRLQTYHLCSRMFPIMIHHECEKWGEIRSLFFRPNFPFGPWAKDRYSPNWNLL